MGNLKWEFFLLDFLFCFSVSYVVNTLICLRFVFLWCFQISFWVRIWLINFCCFVLWIFSPILFFLLSLIRFFGHCYQKIGQSFVSWVFTNFWNLLFNTLSFLTKDFDLVLIENDKRNKTRKSGFKEVLGSLNLMFFFFFSAVSEPVLVYPGHSFNE